MNGDIDHKNNKPYTSESFDYSKDYSAIDFRKHPELYEVGRGEQGVLMVEPYKSEILPYWKFKTPEIAQRSAKAIWKLFQHYKKQRDFVGMDMARKFLQMGFTRARRYANHATGRKYNADGKELPQEKDWLTNPKAESAKIFYAYYQKANEDKYYQGMKASWMERE